MTCSWKVSVLSLTLCHESASVCHTVAVTLWHFDESSVSACWYREYDTIPFLLLSVGTFSGSVKTLWRLSKTERKQRALTERRCVSVLWYTWHHSITLVICWSSLLKVLNSDVQRNAGGDKWWPGPSVKLYQCTIWVIEKGKTPDGEKSFFNTFICGCRSVCQLTVTAYLWSNTLPPQTPATYYLSSHSNLVIELRFRAKAVQKSSWTPRILWNMCYFPPHYFSCVLRCFLSLLIIVTHGDAGIKWAHSEKSFVAEFFRHIISSCRVLFFLRAWAPAFSSDLIDLVTVGRRILRSLSRLVCQAAVNCRRSWHPDTCCDAPWSLWRTVL